MSAETKKNAQNTEYYLREAETRLDDAERSAQGTGDKQLIKKVSTIKESVQQTRKEINEKLNNG